MTGEMTGQERFERVFSLLDTWIDTELVGWKKHDKLSNRLEWMSDRLLKNLNEGCVVASPDLAELEEIDNVSIHLLFFLSFFYFDVLGN